MFVLSFHALYLKAAIPEAEVVSEWVYPLP